MLSGFRFLLGAMVACVLTAAFAIALIASYRLNTTTVGLVAPLNGETLRFEREPIAGTGGPLVAPVSLRELSSAPIVAPEPANAAPADAAPADRPPRDAAPEVTASIPERATPEEAARTPAREPDDAPRDEKPAATKETAAEPQDKSGEKRDKSDEKKEKPEPNEATASAERREPARPRATTRFRLPAPNDSVVPGFSSTNEEPPFRYFLN
jgi:hypothetical protein